MSKVLWLVKISRATFSTNQTKPKPIVTGIFPRLATVTCISVLQVLIGLLQCLRLVWLPKIITVVLFFQHSSENRCQDIVVAYTAIIFMFVFVSYTGTMSLPDMKFPAMLKIKPKYIEVMATADSSVVRFHGKAKSEKYILTLMNIVSNDEFFLLKTSSCNQIVVPILFGDRNF